MDIEHLDEFELEIELGIRNIKGDTFMEKFNNLKTIIEQESTGNSLPTQMHDKAAQNPASEIIVCMLKLKVIRDRIRDQLTCKLSDPLYEIEKPVMDRMNSKLLHTLARLRRVSILNEFKSTTFKLSTLGESIRSILQSPNDHFNTLNQNIKSLDALDFDGVSTASTPTEKDSSTPSNHIVSELPNQPEAVRTEFSVLNQSNTVIQHPTMSSTHTYNQNHDSVFSAQGQSTCICPSRNMSYSSMNQNSAYQFAPIMTSSQTNQPQPLPPVTMPINNQCNPPSILKRVPGSNHHKPRISLAREIQNLRFNGTIDGEDIDDFLYRFETLAVDFGLSAVQYVEEFHGLLEGPALRFYWSCRRNDRFILWEQLRQAFRERFRSFYSDDVIRLTLENRRQKPGEPFLVFYNDLLNISNRLRTPLYPNELFSLLTKNMVPSLQVELAPVKPTTVVDMVERCVNIETTWDRVRSYQNVFRPRRSVNEIQSEPVAMGYDQYLSSLNNNIQAQHSTTPVDSTHVQNPPPNIDAMHTKTPSHQTNNLKCWNCEGPHRYHDCEVPQKEPFCYGCGRKGILKPHCPACKINQGNRYQGVRNTGNAHLLNPESQTESATNTDPELYRRQNQFLKR